MRCDAVIRTIGTGLKGVITGIIKGISKGKIGSMIRVKYD